MAVFPYADPYYDTRRRGYDPTIGTPPGMTEASVTRGGGTYDPGPPVDPANTVPKANAIGGGMSESEKYFQAMQSAMKNKPAQEKFRGMLNEAPQQSQYPTSKWRAVGASLVGAAEAYDKGAGAGMEAATRFARAPYQEAMEKYGLDLGRAKIGAEMEQGDISAQVEAMQNAAKLGLDYDKFQSQREIDLEKNKIEWAKIRDEYTEIKEMGQSRFVNKHNPKDYFTMPTATVEAYDARTKRLAQEETGRHNIVGEGVDMRNATTNEFVAGSGRINALTGQAKEVRESRQEDNRIEILRQDLRLRSAIARTASPQEIDTAYMQSLRELAGDPRFRDTITRNDKTGELFFVQRDLTQPEYEALLNEIEERTEYNLEKHRIGVEGPPTPRSPRPYMGPEMHSVPDNPTHFGGARNYNR